ncbi:MAG: hypothetical protein BMS9Abin01_0058 [Gammaproteobacteria bacterium]|nr:MAG: hypothetical protein BMS9Abin01_0058 [Gammaproteobacteria bacterium]
MVPAPMMATRSTFSGLLKFMLRAVPFSLAR